MANAVRGQVGHSADRLPWSLPLPHLVRCRVWLPDNRPSLRYSAPPGGLPSITPRHGQQGEYVRDRDSNPDPRLQRQERPSRRRCCRLHHRAFAAYLSGYGPSIKPYLLGQPQHGGDSNPSPTKRFSSFNTAVSSAPLLRPAFPATAYSGLGNVHVPLSVPSPVRWVTPVPPPGFEPGHRDLTITKPPSCGGASCR